MASSLDDAVLDAKPYKMHVSARYLELTMKKLDLARLPHDLEGDTLANWKSGVPKAVLEPLMDYWIENYSWRTQEALFNRLMPQFRAIVTPTISKIYETLHPPLRMHFVHRRSRHTNAIPLLFCHGWPGSFIEASKIIELLCDPVSAPLNIGCRVVAFHVVIPSIPGFGFGDPSPLADFGLRETADFFDTLMSKLGYDKYVVHGTGWGFKIARLVALRHQEHCIAVHTTSPHIPECSFDGNFLNYVKYRLAKLTKARFSLLSFGYTSSDFQYSSKTQNCQNPLGLGKQECHRIHTLAYSVCDSPVGLLAYMVDAIRQSYGSYTWTVTDILNWTMLQWLPGPETGLKWLSIASQEVSQKTWWRQQIATPLGISHFRPSFGTGFTTPSSPLWASNIFNLTWIRRHQKSARFPAWDAPDDLVMDVRDFVMSLIEQRRLSLSFTEN